MGAPNYQYEQLGIPIKQLSVVETTPEPVEHDLAQELVESLGEYIGYWPLLGIILAGLLFIFKRRIKRALVAFIREK